LSILDKLTSGEVFILLVLLIVSGGLVLATFADAIRRSRAP
jgi:hypothetical protein